jgi:hypothetical protein
MKGYFKKLNILKLQGKYCEFDWDDILDFDTLIYNNNNFFCNKNEIKSVNIVCDICDEKVYGPRIKSNIYDNFDQCLKCFLKVFYFLTQRI